MKWEHHTKGSGVSIQLQHKLASDQEKGRHCLIKLFTSVEYLARQALPLRGHYEASGNFYQLMQLQANDSEELKTWLHQKKAYISHEIQNEMLKIMSQQIQRSLLKFTIS